MNLDELHPYGPGSHAVLVDVREMPGCYPIKGNVRADGRRFYHRPDSRNYGATKPEVWFDSPSAAEAAGFVLAPTHRDNTSNEDYEPGGSGHPCSQADVETNRAAAVARISGVSNEADPDAPINPLVSAGATAEGDDLELGRTAHDPAIHPYGVGSRAPLDDPKEMPRFYPVKGNIRRNRSRLYHRPDSSSYRITGAEVWFDSPSAAEAAGFRMARTHPKTSTSEPFEPGGDQHGWTAEEVRQERLRAFYGPSGVPSEPVDTDDDEETGDGPGLGAAAAGAAVVVGSASLISRDTEESDEAGRDTVVAPVSPSRRDVDDVDDDDPVDETAVFGSVAGADTDDDPFDGVESDDDGLSADPGATAADTSDDVDRADADADADAGVHGPEGGPDVDDDDTTSAADDGDQDDPAPATPFLSLVTTPPGDGDAEPSVHAGAFTTAPVLSLVGTADGPGDDEISLDHTSGEKADQSADPANLVGVEADAGDRAADTTGSEDPELVFGSSGGAGDGTDRTSEAEVEDADGGGAGAVALAGAGLLVGAGLLGGDDDGDTPDSGDDETIGADTGDVEPGAAVAHDPSVTAPLPAGAMAAADGGAATDDGDESLDDQAFGAGAGPSDEEDDEDATLVAPVIDEQPAAEATGAAGFVAAAAGFDRAAYDDPIDAEPVDGGDLTGADVAAATGFDDDLADQDPADGDVTAAGFDEAPDEDPAGDDQAAAGFDEAPDEADGDDGDEGAPGVAAAAMTAPLAAGAVAGLMGGNTEPESIQLEEDDEDEDATVEVPAAALAGMAAGGSAGGADAEVADASAGSGSASPGRGALLGGRDGCGRGLWLAIGLLLLLLLLALLLSRCGDDDSGEATGPAATEETTEQDSATGDAEDLGAASPLDSDLEASALASLADAGFDDLALEIDGDTVRLTGRVPTEADSEAAFAALAAVEGMEGIEIENGLEVEDLDSATTVTEGGDEPTSTTTPAPASTTTSTLDEDEDDAAVAGADGDGDGDGGTSAGDESSDSGTGDDETPVPDPVDEDPRFTG